MRFARLDLARFGHFTECRVDFGPLVQGRPDLHVVYGPNEAGKSTAVAGILDLLFGIEMRSRFHFLHDYPAMRVGASIELGGAARDYVRVKRNHGSLLDAADRPVDETPIAVALSGLDRHAYRDAFSMDEETLEAGGEGILASKGDLGRLLFAASAGLSNVSGRLAEARADADAFHKARARSGELASLKARLADLKRQKEEIDTVASRHAQLAGDLEGATGRYEGALAARGLAQARHGEIGRRLGAMPFLATSRVLRARIRELADLPQAPPSWRAELPDLQVRSVRATTRLTGIEGRIRELSTDIDDIRIDEDALSLAGEVRSLGDLRARDATAEVDLPERRAQLRAAELAIEAMVGRLGQEPGADARRLVLDASTTGTLRDLIESRSGIEVELRNAHMEALEAERLLAEARGTPEGADAAAPGPGPGTAEVVAAALSAVQGSDVAARTRLAERDRSEADAGLRDALSGLRPWCGDGTALAAMVVPAPDDVEGWKVRMAEAQGRAASASEAVSRADADHRRHQAELDAAAAVSGLVPDQDAGSVRAERERAWAAHRRTLDHASADEFEAVLRRDDATTVATIGREKDMARLRLAHEGRALAAAAAAAAREALIQAADDLRHLREEVVAAVEPIGYGLGMMDLTRLEGWLGRRSTALALLRRLGDAECDLAEAGRERELLHLTLSRALSAVGVDHDGTADMEVLVGDAKLAVARLASAVEARSRIAERGGELARRNQILRAARDADRRWRDAWGAACSGCWLGEGTRQRSPSEVRGIMEVLDQLAPAIERRANLADRIGKMEADQDAFGRAVAAIAIRLASLDATGRPAEVMRRLQEAVSRAEAGATRLRDKRDELARVRSEGVEVAEEATAAARRAGEMLSFFGVQTLAEVGVKLQELERRADLVKQAEDAEREVAVAIGAGSVADAEAVLDGSDRQALEAELAELQGRLADQDQEVRDAFASLTVARRALDAIGGDDAVARLAEVRRTTLLEISDKALGYLRLRTGVAAAEQALRLYRERHRSTMMTAASEAFRALTCGAYARLESRPERDGETLIAMTSRGRSLTADALSKGTRFQLYLALRVAAYAEFARTRRPVPFIVDDAFETFDDPRAAQAFGALARMASVGQVIVFTHHAHLCRIAAEVCPTVRIHELPPAPHQVA